MRRMYSFGVPNTVGGHSASQPATFQQDVRLQLDGGAAVNQFAIFATDDPDTPAGTATGVFDPGNRATWPPGCHTYLGIVSGGTEKRIPSWGPHTIAMRVGGGTQNLNLVASGLYEITEITAQAPTVVGNHGDAINISAIEGEAVVAFEDDALAADICRVFVTDLAVSAGAGEPAGCRFVDVITKGKSCKIAASISATQVVLWRVGGTAARRVRISGKEGGDSVANLSTVERDALSPGVGTPIWNTDLDRLEVYNGAHWVPVGDPSRYGDATDGALYVGNGQTVTLTAIPYYRSVTVANGGTLVTKGLPIFCKGAVDISGTVDASGSNAAGAVAGAHGSLYGTAAGAGGAATTVGHDAVAQAVSYVAGGGNGGGGAATAGGAAANVNGAGKGPHDAVSILAMVAAGSLNGASGGGGGGGGAAAGGGGGGGSGPLVIVAPAIHLGSTAVLKAKGGNGGNGAGAGAGGGGGGGGSLIALLTAGLADDGANFLVTGGTGGTAGAGATAGGAGHDGVALGAIPY